MAIPEIIKYALYGIPAIFVAVCAFLGWRRGVQRQTMRLVTIAAAAVIAFLVADALFPKVLGAVEGKTLSAIMQSIGFNLRDDYVAFIDCLDTDVACLLGALPVGLVVIPLLFLVIFIILSMLFELVHKLICGVLGYTRGRNNLPMRFLGLCFGVFQGALVALLILNPFVGAANIADTAVSEAVKNHPEAEGVVKLSSKYESYVGKTKEHIVYRAANKFGGWFYDRYTTVEIDGDTVNLKNAAISIVDMVALGAGLDDTDWAKLTETDKATITDMTVDVHKDPYLAKVVSGVLRFVSRSYGNQNNPINIPVLREEPMATFFNAYLSVLKTSDHRNIREDLDTTRTVYFIMSDNGVLKASEDGIEALFDAMLAGGEGKSTLGQITAEFQKNPRMTHMATAVSNLSVQLLLGGKGMDSSSEETAKTVESVKGGINDALAIDKESFETHEEYKAAVNDSLHNTLEQNGIELDEEQTDKLTDYVINEMEDVEEITDADIADFMSKYYDIYMSTGKLPDGFEPPLDSEIEIPDKPELPEIPEIPETPEIPEIPEGAE